MTKRILYISKPREPTPEITVLESRKVNRLHLIGKRFDKVLIEAGVLLNEGQWIELNCCQYKDIDNWIEVIDK